MELRGNRLLHAFLLALVCFAAYANSVGSSFHWEDELFVKDNIHIRSARNLPDFFRPGYVNVYESGMGQRYRPLRTVSFVLDYALWQDRPSGYHLTNIALHAMAAELLWLLLLALGAGPMAALAGAMLFALHPLHTESIAYIKNRSDLLCALFYLSSMLAFVKAYAAAGWRRWTWLSVSVLAAAATFLSKEMALALPFVVSALAVTLYPGREKAGLLRAQVLCAGHYAVLCVYLLFKEFSMGGGYSRFPGGTWEHFLFVLATVGGYIKLLFWPVSLSLDRVMLVGPLIPWGGASFVLLVIILAVYFAVRRDRLRLFLTVFLLFSLVPVSNLLYLVGRPFAEQRAYIPSMAFCALAGLLLQRGAGRLSHARLKLLALAVLALLYAGRTIARNSDWRDETTLWRKTAMSSRSARAYHNLAVAEMRAGDYGAALGDAETCRRLDPGMEDVYNTLGGIYDKLGLTERAAGMFSKAAELSGWRDYVAMMNLATMYGKLGRLDESLSLYTRVVSLAPWLDEAFFNMGVTLEKLGRPGDASRAYQECLSLNPYVRAAYLRLAGLAAASGDKAAAASVYSRLAAVYPDDPAAAAFLTGAGKTPVDKSSQRP